MFSVEIYRPIIWRIDIAAKSKHNKAIMILPFGDIRGGMEEHSKDEESRRGRGERKSRQEAFRKTENKRNKRLER
jgi:hypothetical protein